MMFVIGNTMTLNVRTDSTVAMDTDGLDDDDGNCDGVQHNDCLIVVGTKVGSNVGSDVDLITMKDQMEKTMVIELITVVQSIIALELKSWIMIKLI